MLNCAARSVRRAMLREGARTRGLRRRGCRRSSAEINAITSANFRAACRESCAVCGYEQNCLHAQAASSPIACSSCASRGAWRPVGAKRSGRVSHVALDCRLSARRSACASRRRRLRERRVSANQQADIAARRPDGADERDDRDDGERVECGQGDARCHHQDAPSRTQMRKHAARQHFDLRSVGRRSRRCSHASSAASRSRPSRMPSAGGEMIDFRCRRGSNGETVAETVQREVLRRA